MIRKTLLVLALVVGALPVWSQVATGLYNYGSFDSLGFDSIDRGSLNVHFSIPVVNKSGRGLPFQYTLVYDGLVWAPTVSGGVTSWTISPSFGLEGYLLNEGYKGYLSYITLPEICGRGGNTTYQNTHYTYHDQFGVSHYFNYSSDVCKYGTVGDGSTNDGSGYSFNGTNVIARNGATLTLPVYLNGAAQSLNANISDANGNQVINNQNGTFTDTTGANVLSITGNGTAASPKVFSYLTYGANPNNTNPPSASVKITYKTYQVETAFGCSGVGEYNLSADLPDRITLADTSFYQFTYELTPGQQQGGTNVTGRLASITLPTGGTMSYGYTGANNGINCSDGTPTGVTRTTSDGSRTYVRSLITTTSSHTDIADGSATPNHSAFDFVTAGTPTAFYETNEARYAGAVSGTALVSRQTCYNGASAPCTTTALTLPVAQTDTYETLNGLQEHGSTAKYNSWGLQTEEDDYDFGGVSARGSLLRKEVWVYPTSGIVSLLTSDTVTDGSGNQISQTTYGYDETSGTGHAALKTTSGLPQHSGAVGTQRGNVTTVTQWNNLGTLLTTDSSYEDTGNALSSTGPNGQSTYGYDSATHAFLNGLTPPTPSSGVSLPIVASSDANTGLPLTATDPNGTQAKYVSYTDLLQPLEIDNLDSGNSAIGKTTFAYPSPNEHSVQSFFSASTSSDTHVHYDGYARADRVEQYNGQSSDGWYQQDICFDANGRLLFQSYPYQGNGFSYSKVCSGAGDTYSYDAIGRLIEVLHADGTNIRYSYDGRATEVVDEGLVSRISQVDGLGRIKVLCEVSASNLFGGGTPVACGTDGSGSTTGYLTTYAYTLDASNDQVTTITQGAQTRTFVTDSLGRTVSVTEPERGTTTYSYTYNGTGLAVTRTRFSANQNNSCIAANTCASVTTTTQYDSIGRTLSLNYVDGLAANSGLSPNKQYDYDKVNSSMAWSSSITSGFTNLKGFMADFASGSGATLTRGLVSHDASGRVTGMWQCAPSICGTANQAGRPALTFAYDWQGNLTGSYDVASGQINYTRSLAGEVISITNQTYPLSGTTGTGNLVLNNTVVNGPNGVISYSLGNGVSQLYHYDSLGRQQGGWVATGPPTTNSGPQLYAYSIDSRQGNEITSVSDDQTGHGTSYTYDNFGRLQSTSYATGQTYTYYYDRYGNRWSQVLTGGGTGPQPGYGFSATNNQINGYTYDAAGNMMNDGTHSYQYDAEGNVRQVDGGSTATYVYDAMNRRVRAQTSASTYEYLYDYAGRRTSSWLNPSNNNPGTANEGRIYWDGRQIAYRASDGTTYFDHQDYLGTEKIRTNYQGAVAASYKSLPWGDNYSSDIIDAPGGQDSLSFAGLDFDTESNTQQAQFRNYSTTQGRWLVPDPYDGSYDVTNPQSFNRYAYAQNNPLSFRDPLGLNLVMDCDADGNCTEYDDGEGDGSGGDPGGSDCSAAGGNDVCVTAPAPGTDLVYDLQVAFYQLPRTISYEAGYLNWRGNMAYEHLNDWLNSSTTLNNALQSSTLAQFGCFADPGDVMAINNMENGLAFPTPSGSTDGQGASAIYMPNPGASKNGGQNNILQNQEVPVAAVSAGMLLGGQVIQGFQCAQQY